MDEGFLAATRLVTGIACSFQGLETQNPLRESQSSSSSPEAPAVLVGRSFSQPLHCTLGGDRGVYPENRAKSLDGFRDIAEVSPGLLVQRGDTRIRGQSCLD